MTPGSTGTTPAATTDAAAECMPTVFISHGAPPLVDDALWVSELQRLAAHLPRPKAILMPSAHWEAAPTMLGATEPAPLVYDFAGFPRRYYDVTYAAPGAPNLADQVAALSRIPSTSCAQTAASTTAPMFR